MRLSRDTQPKGNRNCQVGWCHGSECVGGLKWSETDYTIFMVTFKISHIKLFLRLFQHNPNISS